MSRKKQAALDVPATREEAELLAAEYVTGERNILEVTLNDRAQAQAAPFEVGFTLADNSIVALDAEAAIGFGLAVGGYVAAVYARSFELRGAIEAAEDDAALAAIDFGSGWPA